MKIRHDLAEKKFVPRLGGLVGGWVEWVGIVLVVFKVVVSVVLDVLLLVVLVVVPVEFVLLMVVLLD